MYIFELYHEDKASQVHELPGENRDKQFGEEPQATTEKNQGSGVEH